ncbi:MAG: hypothetical protein ACFFAS_20255 [Promethearchaeota archaeon]
MVDYFLIELTELVSFRKEFVFYTDFVTKEEYQQLLTSEDSDFSIQRMIIRCPCGVSLNALNTFEKYKSWIIGATFKTINTHPFNSLAKLKIKKYLIIKIAHNQISTEIGGIDIKTINLIFERAILQKIIEDTDNSIMRMKRVLLDKIKLQHIDSELAKMLLNFETEKIEIKMNIFNKEIQNFYSGSKRAYFILSRLELLKNLKVNANIGNKTLLKTIDYTQNPKINSIFAPIERMLSFIYQEWSEDFFELVVNDKKLDLGNKIQGLWG